MEIVIRKKQESKWNTEHWKLDIDWKMLLSCGKRTSYKKCPTILSKEFKKSFNYLVKFSLKKNTYCLKQVLLNIKQSEFRDFTFWASTRHSCWTHWEGDIYSYAYNLWSLFVTLIISDAQMFVIYYYYYFFNVIHSMQG